VTFDNVAGLVVALAVIGYLVAALVFPEKF
jgi:K+-transporting ATPase KdpF subunit